MRTDLDGRYVVSVVVEEGIWILKVNRERSMKGEMGVAGKTAVLQPVRTEWAKDLWCLLWSKGTDLWWWLDAVGVERDR